MPRRAASPRPVCQAAGQASHMGPRATSQSRRACRAVRPWDAGRTHAGAPSRVAPKSGVREWAWECSGAKETSREKGLKTGWQVARGVGVCASGPPDYARLRLIRMRGLGSGLIHSQPELGSRLFCSAQCSSPARSCMYPKFYTRFRLVKKIRVAEYISEEPGRTSARSLRRFAHAAVRAGVDPRQSSPRCWRPCR